MYIKIKLKIAKAKAPGNTKSVMCRVEKMFDVLAAVAFGGRRKGMAKWTTPKTIMNAAST